MKFLTTDLDSAPQVWLNCKFSYSWVCDFDFIAIINLGINMGFERESRSGCDFKPSVIIHSQITYEFSNLLSS